MESGFSFGQSRHGRRKEVVSLAHDLPPIRGGGGNATRKVIRGRSQARHGTVSGRLRGPCVSFARLNSPKLYLVDPTYYRMKW